MKNHLFDQNRFTFFKGGQEQFGGAENVDAKKSPEAGKKAVDANKMLADAKGEASKVVGPEKAKAAKALAKFEAKIGKAGSAFDNTGSWAEEAGRSFASNGKDPLDEPIGNMGGFMSVAPAERAKQEPKKVKVAHEVPAFLLGKGEAKRGAIVRKRVQAGKDKASALAAKDIIAKATGGLKEAKQGFEEVAGWMLETGKTQDKQAFYEIDYATVPAEQFEEASLSAIDTLMTMEQPSRKSDAIEQLAMASKALSVLEKADSQRPGEIKNIDKYIKALGIVVKEREKYVRWFPKELDSFNDTVTADDDAAYERKNSKIVKRIAKRTEAIKTRVERILR